MCSTIIIVVFLLARLFPFGFDSDTSARCTSCSVLMALMQAGKQIIYRDNK